MSLWKQLVLCVGLVAAALGLSARFLPASHPVLQRIGLLAPPGMVAQPPRLPDAPPAVGHDPRSIRIKGLAARICFAFTESSPPTAAIAPATPPPAAMARVISGRKGAGEPRVEHARAVGQGARR